MAGEAGQSRARSEIELRESDLKKCELCGWLNLVSNSECFVCGWRGRFERSPDAIHTSVELMIRRFGRIDLDHLTNARTYRRHVPLSLRSRVVRWLRRLLRAK